MQERRKISLMRAEELKRSSDDYEKAKCTIPKGTDEDTHRRYEEQKDQLLRLLGAGQSDWDSWTWQMANRVDDVETLEQVIALTQEERDSIAKVSGIYRWAVTPYYLALIDPDDPDDPIRMMAAPSGGELDSTGQDDPMSEEFTNPAGSITRRYPDRLIINTTNSCAMFCRHCQRRRRIGEFDKAVGREIMDESIQYVRENPEIRDVLITGGDPLTLSDKQLEYIVSGLREIPHVEIIRIGTRAPVTLPQRITGDLIKMLKKYHPIYFNTQFNHAKELTPESIAACNLLVDNGFPVGNQMVLLEGVNNDKFVVRLLNHELLKARVRPYYIFHAKQVSGTLHFKTSVDDGLEIMEHLRGFTSGMAIPTYIINAPGGLGKVPLLPQYLVEKDEETVTLRTWEGKLVTYPNQKKKLCQNNGHEKMLNRFLY